MKPMLQLEVHKEIFGGLCIQLTNIAHPLQDQFFGVSWSGGEQNAKTLQCSKNSEIPQPKLTKHCELKTSKNSTVLASMVTEELLA